MLCTSGCSLKMYVSCSKMYLKSSKLLNFYFSTKWKLDRQDFLKWLNQNLNWNGISKKHWPQCTSIYSFHQKIVWNVKPHENHDRWMKIARIASQKYISLGANHKVSHQFFLNLWPPPLSSLILLCTDKFSSAREQKLWF